MANIPEKPSVELVSWINGRTKLNQINLTTGVNANLASIKTAVDGIIDVLDEDCLPKSAGRDEALTGVLYSDVNDISLVGTQGKAGFRAYKPNTTEQAAQMLLTSDGTVSGSYRLSAQTYNKTQSDAAGSAVYNTLRMGDTEGLTYKIGSDVKFKVNDSGVATVGADPVSGLDVATKQYVDYQACLVETTWSALKALRDGGNLVPGQQYRITDYQCTTIQANTSSAGHQFDIIVVADSKNTLNEKARACLHTGDTYFASSKLDAWELWYSLDNDAARFSWALFKYIKVQLYSYLTVNYYRAEEFDDLSKPYGYAWLRIPSSSSSNMVYTNTDTPTLETKAYTSMSGEDEKDIIALNNEHGKGVVYRMIDEFNNDCPYDFKNILFTKSEKYTNAYTFTCIENSIITDASLLAFRVCYDNIIKKYIRVEVQQLNFNVFYSTSHTFSCYSNTFGNDCYHNTFGNDCQYNTFGNSCSNNTFGYAYKYNTLGNDCSNNTLGNSCSNNTFGGYCQYNTFGDACSHINFGDYCQRNTFANNCQYNTFGGYCQRNTFGNYYRQNTFGCYCRNNTFGDSSSTIDYCRNNIIDKGCQYLYINGNGTASSSNYLQNIHIHLGVGGTSSAYKTITVDRNLAYETNIVPVGTVYTEV